MANRNKESNKSIALRRFLPAGTSLATGGVSTGKAGDRGIALVTVLLVVALLIAVVVEFNRIALADIQVKKK